MRTAKPSSSRKKTRLDDREGGPSGPPLMDGQRPGVPTGLKSARQLIAAVPIAREGKRVERAEWLSHLFKCGILESLENQSMGMFAGPLPENDEAS